MLEGIVAAGIRGQTGLRTSPGQPSTDEAVGYQKLFSVAIQPHALWCAQNDVYADTNRRPYVMTGVYPQSVKQAAAGELTPYAVLLNVRVESEADILSASRRRSASDS